MIRVALVDDQELVRAGFTMVLNAQSDMTVTGEAGDGAAAVTLAARGLADVMVMDVRMPGMDGVAAARQICAAGPRPRVLMLTTFDLDEYAFAALKAGASGFLLKDVPPQELLFAIRAVHSGDSVVAPSTTRRLIDRFVPLLAEADAADGANRSPAGSPPFDELTEREREVLIQVAAGLSNAEIAARLYVSETTVKTHVGRILAKLGLRDRVQAVVLAYETGLVRARSLALLVVPARVTTPLGQRRRRAWQYQRSSRHRVWGPEACRECRLVRQPMNRPSQARNNDRPLVNLTTVTIRWRCTSRSSRLGSALARQPESCAGRCER